MNTFFDAVSTGVKNWWWFTIKGMLLVVAEIPIFPRPATFYLFTEIERRFQHA